MSKHLAGISKPLVDWYRSHERTFPWRTDPSPYRVWVSEIMLQQTRIEAALPYFERFMQTLPTVQALAEASEDILLKLWEGLGYYSRVRNLQKAAQQIMIDHGGQLPDKYDELLKLAGIGEYTAGAIASIAFGERVAAVDGNVLRVMARLLDEDADVMQPAVRKRLAAIVGDLVPADDPGGFNEGLMELGETICLPNTMPLCDRCPIRDFCAVSGTERAAQLPTRKQPKPRKVEQRTVQIVIADKRVLLHKRDNKGLLSGMWELPNRLQEEGNGNLPQEWNAMVLRKEASVSGKHVFSHIEWHLTGEVFFTNPFDPPQGYVWVSEKDFEQYALPTAFRLFAQQLPRYFSVTGLEPVMPYKG